jgi:hypothetical protein
MIPLPDVLQQPSLRGGGGNTFNDERPLLSIVSGASRSRRADVRAWNDQRRVQPQLALWRAQVRLEVIHSLSDYGALGA